MQYIFNATLYTPTEVIHDGALLVEDGHILASAPATTLGRPDGAAPAQGGFVIESPAGSHRVQRDAHGGFVIDMGRPRFAVLTSRSRGRSEPSRAGARGSRRSHPAGSG